jgi:predicted Ser/Thr protein kinase
LKQLNLFVEITSLTKETHISFNELVVEKEIGEGSYGKVCLGRWNNGKVALKFCRNKSTIDDFVSEIKIMMYVTLIVFFFLIDFIL